MTASLRTHTSEHVFTDTELSRLRADFPILSREIGGQPLAYLDSGATSQKPACVIDAEQEFYTQHNAAVHRGAHSLAVEATEAFEGARETVAKFVGADTGEVCWTKNATEALNVIAMGFANASLGLGGAEAQRFRLQPGDSIVVTEMEHHANLIPWQRVAAVTGARLRYLPLGADGRLDLSELGTVIDESTKVVAFTHVSNVLGTVNPVAQLVERARQVGAYVVLDACQSVPHMSVDFHALDVDFAAFSGHKMLASTGIGAMYGKAELLAALPPVLTGGSMITTVTMFSAEFMAPPARFEAGTQPVVQAVGLASAVDYLNSVGMDRITAHEHALAEYLVPAVQEIPGVRLLGPADLHDRTAAVAVDVEGVHAHDVGQFLDSQGIAIRVGHHCAQPLHRKLGVTASTRATAYLYNTLDECERFIAALKDVRAFFGAR